MKLGNQEAAAVRNDWEHIAVPEMWEVRSACHPPSDYLLAPIKLVTKSPSVSTIVFANGSSEINGKVDFASILTASLTQMRIISRP